MLKRAIILLLCLASLLGMFYCFDPFALNEKKILRDTRKTYKTIQFEKEPFLKKEEIQDFTEFLLRHIEEIKNHNRHEEYRKIQLTRGWTSHYTNTGDCFIMPTFRESFIKDYIPPELVDSLYHYSNGLRNDLIVSLSICSEKYDENIDSTKGSVSFSLKKKGKTNENYYLFHKIIQNRKFRLSKTVNTIYDYGLAKDTLLLNELRYTILITPYSGI